jgi:hypothetical protein
LKFPKNSMARPRSLTPPPPKTMTSYVDDPLEGVYKIELDTKTEYEGF